MTLRRLILLLLGAAGGILAGSVLCFSASNMLSNDNIPLVSVLDPPAQADSVSADIPIEFPVQVPGTTLLAERLTSYDGPFLEDGSDREVVGAAALLVRNFGSKEILRAYIELQTLDINYSFYVEHIPPGAQVLILDQCANKYGNAAVFSCYGWQKEGSDADDDQRSISVTDEPMGKLVVENLSDEVLYNVCLYYKNWLSPPDIYVGGVTYSITIPVLKPGTAEYAYPHHYACGYSKVVSVIADRGY